MNYAYIRVSTKEQNEARQLKTLEKYRIDEIFSEKISGADMDRPKLQEMLRKLKSGDTVYISDFSRLARSTYDLLTMIKAFEVKGINLVSDKEKLDMSTPQGKLILTILAAVNEFERSMMLERQAEGIEIAKAKGKFKNCGRKKAEVDEEEFSKDLTLLATGELTKIELAKKMNVSRPTLDKIIKEKSILHTQPSR